MNNPEPRRGPLVHRAVHHGAALWLVAALQFVAVMVIVQLAWSGPPAYSLQTNRISDLGNTACGPWPTSTSSRVCSPWHDAFDGSVIALGLLVLLGAILARTAFPRRGSATLGLAMLAVSGLGEIGVGIAPENLHPAFHVLCATVAFLLGSLALVVLSVAMFRDTRWDGYRVYAMISGLVGLAALGLLATSHYFGLGEGGMERLVAAPSLLFLVVASIHLLRVPQYAPHTIVSSSGP